MARSRTAAPSLARTRSAAPAVGILLDYAAPELAAWVSANREAVLRAAEAVDAAYVAAVDALAPRLPGGESAWERASATLTIYDSESEEHRARKPSRIENVEGWQSRIVDKDGRREVIALLPVRLPASEGFVARLDNRWVSGHGSDRVWTLTTAWPSPETPLELAGYEMRRRGVRAAKESEVSSSAEAKKHGLDPIHGLVLEAYRLEARKPLSPEGRDTRQGIYGFGTSALSQFLRAYFPFEGGVYAVVRPQAPGVPVAFVQPAMMRRVQKVLLDSGSVLRDPTGLRWSFAPVEPLTQEEYDAERAALRARVEALASARS